MGEHALGGVSHQSVRRTPVSALDKLGLSMRLDRINISSLCDGITGTKHDEQALVSREAEAGSERERGRRDGGLCSAALCRFFLL